ncbi:MAG: hypothetical protein AUH43_12800 [Acidobacteria bacterium 13_1_40CM_65_14]|jgi:hypothetical protein|nr:MAG: hypothetical protein AUH43_12800 [Acidobacteria bacterium 13_1_40CM_65_14]OLC83235.1 MAG: hypothetical protein AUH72_04840 [Acidobacteria bacterium 13_1_40CM_4_65_8]OLD21586.1 MAG: hypothetical protein AUJ01_01850 [Acidobacteria bacterium 13_1_40CM_3_65_5]OLE82686.1 MAG: hypothetical protein AUF76_08450 [Acidobacteria bacterium 13_1_20CM_2_65_9]
MQFARRVFIAAGVYGLLVVGPMYVLESRINEQQPPAITHPEYYYGFIGVTLSWQILYLIIGRHPIKYRTIMLVGIFAKTSYGIAACMLYAAGRLPFVVFAVSLIDLVWAVLFAIAYGKTPERETS